MRKWCRWIAICAVVAATQVSSGTNPSVKPVYAYTTDSELVVASGADVITRFGGNFGNRNWLSWTFDGRFAIALEAASEGLNERIIAVELATGTVRKLDCYSCSSIQPVGDNEVVAVRAEERADPLFLVFDLDHESPPKSYSTSGLYRFGELYLVGSTKNQVLAAGPDQEFQDGLRLFLVDANGLLQDVGILPSAEADVGQVGATLQVSAGPAMFTVAARTAATKSLAFFSGCKTHSLSNIDADTGAISSIATPVNNDRKGIYPHSLWRESGQLYAAIESSDCWIQTQGSGLASNGVTSGVLWRLDGATWLKVEDGSPGQEELSRFKIGDKLSLVIPLRSQDLYLSKLDGGRTLVATSINSLATPHTRWFHTIRESPPPPSPKPTVSPAAGCPSEDLFNRAVNEYYLAGTNVPTELYACQDGWAIGFADTPNGSGPTAIVRVVNGQWTVVSFYRHGAVCGDLPPMIKKHTFDCL